MARAFDNRWWIRVAVALLVAAAIGYAVSGREEQPAPASPSSSAEATPPNVSANEAPAAARDRAAAPPRAASSADAVVDAQALLERDPQAALDLIERASPAENGVAEELELVAIHALVRLDRMGAARSRTAAYHRRYPQGRFTSELSRLTGYHPRPLGPE